MAGIMLQDFAGRRLFDGLASRQQWAVFVWIATFLGLNAFSITTLAGEVHRLNKSHYLNGKIMLLKGKLDRAREYFEAAIEEAPQDPRAHEGLGHVYAKEGLLDEAAAQFRKGLEAGPERISIRSSLVAVLLDQKKYAGAIEQLEALTRLNPDSADVQYQLAIAHSRNGNNAAALKACEKAIELDPQSAQLKRLRASLLRKLQTAPSSQPNATPAP
jgi:tetratricopeptide (TPR) repeat protein